MKSKRGLSPVVATILLIAMVIVIGLIIFLWFRGLGEEAITKLGKNVELVCDDVGFSADYDSSSQEINIVNDGTVNLFGMKVKIIKSGSHETKDLADDFSNWPKSGLTQGQAVSVDASFGSDVEEVVLIPVLAGESEEGKKAFVCKEKDGVEITLI